MKTKIKGVELDYQISGSGGTIALAHSLGMAGSILDPLRSLLEPRRQVLTWDARGHGNSGRATGWSVEDLAEDLHGLLQHIGVQRAVVGGLSLGGCTAIAYALAHPEAVEALILMDTTAGYGEANRSAWEQRAQNAETKGMQPIVPFNLPRWFSGKFVEAGGAAMDTVTSLLLQNDPASYAAACRALGKFEARDRVAEIRCPTLIVVGEDDPATPRAMSEQLHSQIAGSQLHVLPGLKHMSAVEAPDRVGKIIDEFLQSIQR